MFFASFSFGQIAVNFSADTTYVCEGYPLQFNDQSSGYNVYKWHWDFGDGGIDSVQNPIHIYNTAGSYTVTLTASSISPPADTSTGTKIKTNYINVRQIPVADFSYTDTLFLPSYLYYFSSIVTNNDELPYHYFWNFDELNFQLGDTVAIHTFPKEGNFSVSLIIEAGAGCVDTITKVISVKDALEVPNVFSPNGDGQNDVFVVKTNGANEFLLEIFNRWGAIIYSQTAKRLQWDGRSSAGVKLPAGIYYYHITSPDVKEYSKAGAILLVN